MGRYDDVQLLAEWLEMAKPLIKDSDSIQKKEVLKRPLKIAMTTEHNIGKALGELQICTGMRKIWKLKNEEEIASTDNEILYLVEVPKDEIGKNEGLYWRAYPKMEQAAEEAERICQEQNLYSQDVQ
jgi:hypothetical protein